MTKQALISVSDKAGVADFARELVALGYSILSTGGTAKLFAKEGIPCREVADYTGFPEMLDGRVKTLDPHIHAGILARRCVPEHMKALEEHHIGTIDIVCVNLYPFEQTIARLLELLVAAHVLDTAKLIEQMTMNAGIGQQRLGMLGLRILVRVCADVVMDKLACCIGELGVRRQIGALQVGGDVDARIH